MKKSISHSFFSFAAKQVSQLRYNGKLRTAETYQTTSNRFRGFMMGQDISLRCIDSALIQSFEGYLYQQELTPNTISFYMRNLRAIYNRAVDAHLIPQSSPFTHVYTGISKTIKRAVTLQVVRNLKSLDLSDEPYLDYARDMFLFSFYTRGMSFVDMAYLRKKDLQGNILVYRRKKTGQLLCVKWLSSMQQIIEKHPANDSPYLLPIIHTVADDQRRQYQNASHLINAKLKILGSRLNLSIPLTMYVARHTWASVAKSKNVSLSVISDAMGHDSETTTRIYLATLDTSMVDQANELILNSL